MFHEYLGPMQLLSNGQFLVMCLLLSLPNIGPGVVCFTQREASL